MQGGQVEKTVLQVEAAREAWRWPDRGVPFAVRLTGPLRLGVHQALGTQEIVACVREPAILR